MLLDFLIVLTFRFFFFDFVLWKKVRECIIHKIPKIKKLFRCPFCQGIWIGTAVFLIRLILGQNPDVDMIGNSVLLDLWVVLKQVGFIFISGFISLCWYVIFTPLIDNMEEEIDVT